jgi:phosphate transport system substrate-binding protein
MHCPEPAQEGIVRVRTVITALTVALVTLSATASAQAKQTITLSGSTSVAPLVSKLAKGYLKAKPGSVKFKVLQGGSDIGVSDVAHGRVTLGMSSRDPLPADPGGLVFNRIARDGICIATNPANPISNISQDQVQAIFSGKLRSWSDVPGSSLSGAIDLFVRSAASGTQDAFQNIFMGQDLRVTPSASQKASNGLVQQSIRSDRNGIGYVDFNFTSGLHTIPYKGIACNLRNAKSGQYGGLRNFWLVSRGKATGAAAKWIKWIRSRKAKKIIAKNWVPLK